MRLWRGSTPEPIEAPHRARLVPDPRETPVDPARLASLLVGAVVGAEATIEQAAIEQIIATHAQSGGALGRMLIDLVGVDERAFADTISRELELPFAELSRLTPDAEATAFVAAPDAHRLGLLPLSYDGVDLTVALVDPLDPEAIRFLEELPPAQVNLLIAPAADLATAMNSAYPALADVGHHVDAFAVSDVAISAAADAAATAVAIGDDDAPVIQVVNTLVTQALRDRVGNGDAGCAGIEHEGNRVAIDFTTGDVVAIAIALQYYLAHTRLGVAGFQFAVGVELSFQGIAEK